MSSSADGTSSSLAKPGKNQFRCFHCRKIFPQRDGDWFPWNTMEVHLCHNCEKQTAKNPERVQAPHK